MDRRIFPRLPVRAETEVRFPTWSVLRLVYTVNISKGGMLLELPQAPPVGAPLAVRLVLPTGAVVELQAVVKHVEQMKAGAGAAAARFGVGVQFQNLDGEKRALIERLLQAHGGSPGPGKAAS